MPDDLSGFEDEFRIALLETQKRDAALRLKTARVAEEIAALKKQMADFEEEMRWRREERRPLPKMIVLRKRTR